jgi:enoyl-[acyl-carrier protein] reductase / trans-2-enoyl-CoA reductase (NAD+)
MKVALPKFQFRFVPSMGNVIHPGNFHPVGTQRAAEEMLQRTAAGEAEAGRSWIVVGGSGGFGSAARVVLGKGRGAATLNVSFDAQPNAQSNNKIRRIGSPGYHRNLAIERGLVAAGRTARTMNGDAFDPDLRDEVVEEIREHFGGKIHGLVWALAAPRATDPRTGQAVHSALRPLGMPVQVKTFTGRDEAAGSRVAHVEIPPGSPEEAIATIFVMGGGVVRNWIETLLAADVLAEGFTLLTVSYRGNPLNEGVYRKGLIGLAKADLEFETAAASTVLAKRVGGRAIAVEGPAVVTEASGGIPGVPFYMAHLMDVMGSGFEDPLASMTRMFAEHFGPAGPQLDDSACCGWTTGSCGPKPRRR